MKTASWKCFMVWQQTQFLNSHWMPTYIHRIFPCFLLLLSLTLVHDCSSFSPFFPHAHLTSYSTSMKCTSYMTSVSVSVCLHDLLYLLKPLYTIRTSLSDMPHLLSRQVVSKPGGELAFLSLSICLFAAGFTHTPVPEHSALVIETSA